VIRHSNRPSLGRTRPQEASGFTLIEVLAAVFLTSIVIAAALSFFVTLSTSTAAATAKTQDVRRAFTVLDRVARDLEGAYLLVKPAEVDPNVHPWLFVAESHLSTGGADRLKFSSRNYRPRNPIDHGSDLGVITYLLHASEDGNGYELLRSLSPGLPESLDREFPSAEDERFMVVADGLSQFAVRLSTDSGEWQDEWDSSLVVESSALPIAAEIEIAFIAEAAPQDPERRIDDFAFANEDAEEGESFVRRVAIPMRPVDLAALLEAATGESADGRDAEDEEDDEYSEDDEAGTDGDPGQEGATAGAGDGGSGDGAGTLPSSQQGTMGPHRTDEESP
jgi:prepilin-type N-terminal cleavage/methylation domain-containing protein